MHKLNLQVTLHFLYLFLAKGFMRMEDCKQFDCMEFELTELK